MWPIPALSFQGSALERTDFEAPPHVCFRVVPQEAGASDALRSQAEPGNEREPRSPSGTTLKPPNGGTTTRVSLLALEAIWFDKNGA